MALLCRHQPCRTYEIAPLVYVTARLSDWLNDVLEPKPWLLANQHGEPPAVLVLFEVAPFLAPLLSNWFGVFLWGNAVIGRGRR
jgi:hypothetical protein